MHCLRLEGASEPGGLSRTRTFGYTIARLLFPAEIDPIFLLDALLSSTLVKLDEGLTEPYTGFDARAIRARGCQGHMPGEGA